LIEILVEAKDIFGQPTDQGYEDLKISTSDNARLLIDPSIASGPNRVVFINCTIPGEYFINVTYKGLHLLNTPLNFTVFHGSISPEQSRIVGFGSWIAPINGSATFYAQLKDAFGNLLFNESSVYPSLHADPDYNGDKPLEILQSKPIKIIAYDARQAEVKSFKFTTEYLGQATWGIRYVYSGPAGTITLRLFYGDELFSELSVIVQEGPFPYPPNSYKIVGPYPAKNEILEVDETVSISHVRHENTLTAQLDKKGWLRAKFSSTFPLPNTDYRATAIGKVGVDKPGKYLCLCSGIEQYSLNTTEVYSGDIW
jgi:hypothetical protein